MATFAKDAASVLARVAARTRQYDFTVWFWGDAIAVDGLLDAREYVGDLEAEEHVLRFLAARPGTAPTWVDYLTPAGALLRAAVAN